jgi:hypothetical protein
MAGWPAHIEHQVLKTAAAAELSIAASDRVRTLLARYPNVSGTEAKEILKYVKRARVVDIQRLAHDETLRRQFEHFVRNHRTQLRYSAAEIVTVIGLVIAFLAICWLLWHPIGGGS